MKTLILFMLFACGLVVNGASKPGESFWRRVARGVDTKIVLNVVDDGGVPVPDSKIHFVFSRGAKYDVTDSVTDNNGNCSVENLTCGNSIEMHLWKEGYYGTKVKLCYIRNGTVHEVKNGKWQPYPNERTVVLKKIRNPIQLPRAEQYFVFPNTNMWFGFDMKTCDFVAPNGKGETSDFECKVEWDGLPPTKSRYCKMSLRMLGDLSGGYYSGLTMESECPFAYAANPPHELIREINIVNRDGNPSTTKIPFRENNEFITRSRCKVDGQGRLKEVNYGSIRRLSVSPSWDGNPTLGLRMVFNPNPNDANLEDIELANRSRVQQRR